MFGTNYDPATGVLRTRLAGVVSVAEVDAWRRGLAAALAGVPDGGTLKLLVDMHGYEPAGLAAHWAMRGVVPLLLHRHGMRPAVFDLVDDPPTSAPTTERGVRVVACANVHHDRDKMEEYERRVGGARQRFFADPGEAERWLLSVSG